MRLMNKTGRAATIVATLLAAASAHAHPGHGAELWHSHGDQTIAVGSLALAVLGAGLAMAGSGANARLQPLRRWGVGLAAAAVAAGLAWALLH